MVQPWSSAMSAQHRSVKEEKVSDGLTLSDMGTAEPSETYNRSCT